MTANMDDSDAVFRHVLVLGGGAVGTLLVEVFRDFSREITVVDRIHELDIGRIRGVKHVIADVTSHGDFAIWAEQARNASLIVISLPESVVLELIPILAAQVPEDTVLVETCSVKANVGTALDVFWHGRPALGINPLFRPSLGARGHRMAVVDYLRTPAWDPVEAAFVSSGLGMVSLSQAEHDRLAVVTQTLTHASLLIFGSVVADACSETDIGDIMLMAPPPFRALLALSLRVAGGEVDVYREIQKAQGGRQIRERMLKAHAELNKAIGTTALFERLQKKIRDAVGINLTVEMIEMSDVLLSSLPAWHQDENDR